MNNCNIVKDLLPLYQEDLLSEDSILFVEDHLEECENCKKLLGDNFEISKTEDNSLKIFKNEIKKEKKKYGLSIVFACISFFVILLFYLTKPIHFEDSGVLFDVNNEGKKIVLTFNKEVSNVDVDENDGIVFVSANTTYIDKILNKSSNISVELDSGKEIYYSNHTKTATKINSFSNGGAMELPRLVLRTFLSFMSILTTTLGLYLFSFNKSFSIKRKFQIFGIPISVVLAYITITGIDGATYYLQRDFFYILVVAFCYFLFLNSIFNIKMSKL